MDELFRHLDHLRRTERRVAMATLVATRGTTPRKEGAKMWVGDGRRVLGSVTIGGCVDARVIAESEEVLATARPRFLSLSLGEADAWDFGLTCSGTVDVLVEPVDLSGTDDAVVRAYEVVRETTGAGRHAAIVTPLAVGGADAPAGAARRLVVLDDGTTVGTLGDAALDGEARGQALAAIRDAQSRTVGLRARGETFAAFVELHGPPATLVVVGATHVAIPLVAFANGLGWRTVVVDGREHLATRERFPLADEIRIGIVGDIAEQLAYGANTFVVLTAHDYKYELPALRVVLARRPAYVGVLGSRRRSEALRAFLREEGVDDEALRRVHIPIGLDIGARTAPEIALSILAEAVAVRGRADGVPMRRRGGA